MQLQHSIGIRSQADNMAPAPLELSTRAPLEASHDLEDPDQTLQIWNIVTQSLCISLTTIFFTLRIYCRIRIQGKVGREDCKSSGWGCAQKVVCVKVSRGSPVLVPLDRDMFGCMGRRDWTDDGARTLLMAR